MGDLISLIESAAFTVLGGLVAGGVGYLAMIVSLREQRRQRHLEEHKSNLKAVGEALDQIFGEVWVFVYGADNLKLPRPPFGNEKRVPNIQIRNEPIALDISNPFSGDGQAIQVGIDTTLFDDVRAHFPELSKMLEETEREVKENGILILKILNSLSEKIYERLEKSDIEFPNLVGTVPETNVKFSQLNNEAIDSDYAGSVFLMVIGEDEDNWPNKVRYLKSNGLYDKLKGLSNEIKISSRNDVNQLLKLHDILFQKISEAKSEIEKIEHTTKLKGKCRYI